MGLERIVVVLLFSCIVFVGLVLAISPAVAVLFLAIRAAPLEGLVFATESAGQQALQQVVGINFFVTILLTIWFVRKQYSLQRLWAFVVVLWPVFYLVTHVGPQLRDLLTSSAFIAPETDSFGLTAIVLLLGFLVYIVPYLFVYYGGYRRVKARVSLKQ